MTYGLVCSQFTAEGRKSMAVSAVILFLTVCVFDIVNKPGMCSTSVYEARSQPFTALHS